MPPIYLGQQEITTLYRGDQAMKLDDVTGTLVLAYTTTTTTTTAEPT